MGRDGKVRPGVRYDTRGRDATIRRRHDQGESMRTIAGAAGCSVGTVHRVIARYERWRRHALMRYGDLAPAETIADGAELIRLANSITSDVEAAFDLVSRV